MRMELGWDVAFSKESRFVWRGISTYPKIKTIKIEIIGIEAMYSSVPIFRTLEFAVAINAWHHIYYDSTSTHSPFSHSFSPYINK